MNNEQHMYSYPDQVILSIHYHKTGCVLSMKLYELFKQHSSNQLIHYKNPIQPRKFIINNDGEFSCEKINVTTDINYTIYNQAAPNFYTDIFIDMPKINKVIHFVRESYDWCISNYLYHSRNPTPEDFFLHINTNVDEWYNEKELRFMTNQINLDYKYILDLIDFVKSIYNCPQNKSYYEYLISLSLEKGLIIETCRFLLNNMDHFRMIIISQLLRPYQNVLTLYMNNFKKSNISTTIPLVYKFIFNKQLLSDNRDNIINEYSNDYNNSNHITNNSISSLKREQLIDILRKEKSISNILDYINLNSPVSSIR